MTLLHQCLGGRQLRDIPTFAYNPEQALGVGVIGRQLVIREWPAITLMEPFAFEKIVGRKAWNRPGPEVGESAGGKHIGPFRGGITGCHVIVVVAISSPFPEQIAAEGTHDQAVLKGSAGFEERDWDATREEGEGGCGAGWATSDDYDASSTGHL